MMNIPADFIMPEGLSPLGQKAWQAIVDHLGKADALHSGGCRAFYSPQQWRKRGEEYGLKSELIVCHDGGDHAVFFDWDRTCYPSMEDMTEALNSVGACVEQCTGWYSAVYAS